MPEGYAINPVTKTNWEGIGVKPDIEVPEDVALKVAEQTALQHLIARTTDNQQLAYLRRELAVLEAAPAEQPKQ
jgi:retinol-binding protein 3